MVQSIGIIPFWQTATSTESLFRDYKHLRKVESSEVRN